MAIAAARSVLRSSSVRNASRPKAALLQFRLPSRSPLAQRLSRYFNSIASQTLTKQFHNSSVRNASRPKAALLQFRLPSRSPLAQRLSRNPVEMSASMQPYHTATASALMTSMLTVTRCGFGWLREAKTLLSLSNCLFQCVCIVRPVM